MSVPKLRFKEFKEEWKLIKLGKIADKITSGARDWAQYYSENGSKFIRMTNLSREGIHLKLDDLKFVNVKAESSDGQRTSLIHGDIPISITAELGKIGWIPPNFGEAFINQHTGLVRLKKEQADSLFIAYLLSTAKLNKQINRLNDSGAKSGLNLPTIASINIHLPKISEQNKIANFFVTIDEKIAQLTQKCELLARYKKGVMQQIFSQELRFEDDGDRNFPDWKNDSLLNLSESGFTNGVFNDPSKVGSGYKLINVLDMYIDLTIDDTKLNLVELSEDEFNRNKVKYGDTFFTRSSLVKEGIAHSNVYLGSSEDVTFDGHLIRMSPKKDLINPMFFYYLLKISQIRQQFVTRGKTTTMTTIGQADIATVVLNFPSIKEQTKIANFLTSIDEKITEAQTYLDTVKQYKQGLLQQMFV